jgi:heparan-sulfate lyase
MKWMATQGKEGKKPTYTLKAYEYSGYYMLRNGWDQDPSKVSMFILKNNYNPKKKWHCQADNNTFSLFHKGRNFFPDAGVYAYSGDPARDKYNQSFWHNTMTITTTNINKMEGHYVHKGTQDNTNYIVTENEPYENSSLTHRRSVFHANKEFFVLVDELYMKNPEEAYNTGKYNLNFNLCAPENEITFDNSNSKAAHGIHTNYSDNNNIVIYTSSEDYDSSATFKSNVSNDHGVVNIENRLGYKISLRKNKDRKTIRAITVIYPTSNPTGTTINAEFTDGGYTGKAVAIKVTVNGTPYELSYTIPENNN